MSSIDDLVQKACPHGVPMRQLGEVGTFVRGNGLQKKDFVESGVGCIHYGQIFTHYRTSANVTKSCVSTVLAAKLRKASTGDLVIATTSENAEDVGKAVAWLGPDAVAVSGDSYVFSHNLDPLYAAYFFQSRGFHGQKRRFVSGTKVKRIGGTDIARIVIPVPPLEVQREVASILSKMEALEAELEAELEARRQQYEHYRARLLSFHGDGPSVRYMTLGEVCSRVSTGGTPLVSRRDFYDGGTIPWLRTQEVRFVDILDTSMRITDRAVEETAAKWIAPNCVIVAISGATAGRSAVNKIPLTTNQHCCNLEVNAATAHYRYVYHWASSHCQAIKALGRGARSDLTSGLIKGYPIAVPPLEDQVRIATCLDAFDSLCTDLEIGLPAEIAARRKQYEYYRDRLFEFERVAA